MDTLPDYPIGAHAPGCDLTQLLRREPDVALAAAEQAQQLGLEPDSRSYAMRWRLSMPSCSTW